ncbi:fatty-acid--CoA ligase [Catellatospora sp. TT07R-123]|uniref:AMP-dependent synthetase/ligase n=1 Tax=Catellatospora sp. TT07R-123 TaxID=2733863 RepID=UPI001B021F73|nr:long-chain fatty acid--CoA ligase [Catellatospora sp. TT07R-123]GHJ48022.1 fatty-acid--CoA ligase [Catellatospora sp. TT07R-123]
MTNPASLCAVFQQTAARTPDAVALRDHVRGTVLTWSQYAAEVAALAAGLAGAGLRRGGTIALMLGNRPEFHLADLAAVHLGATPVSVYNTSSPEQLAHVLRDSGARVAVTEQQYLPRVLACGVPLDLVVCVDGAAPGAVGLPELKAMAPAGFDFAAAWAAVGPDDLLTVIYTSGTTGLPKGVELTHANLLAEIDGLTRVVDLRADDVGLSYLPAAHIADRLASHYIPIVYGLQIVCLSDLARLGEALQQVRPTFWAAVPRVLEKMRARVEDALATAPAPRRWALRAAMRLARSPRRGFAHRLADRAVLAKVRAQLGLDRARWVMSGAAPLPPAVLAYFLELGVLVCDVWGMTETCGVATLNPPSAIRPRTVGRALPGVELRLAEDGELLVRGAITTRGYRGDPARTAELFEDGWLRTGDVATVDADGYVSIVGRKKELIINAAGKNMSPVAIESALLSACPLVGTVAVVGDGRPYNVALVVLDADALAALRRRDPAADPRALVADGVAAANSTLSRVEQIKKFVILPGPWEPGGDELTPTLKLRRSAVSAKYTAEIEQLYPSSGAS